MKLWEPQAGESSVAYQAFAIYRDLGPDRSIDLVRQKLSKSATLFKRWSAKNAWVERATAFDTYLDAVRLAAREQSVAKQARKIMSADEVQAELTEIAAAPWRDFIEMKLKNGEVVEVDLRLTDKIRSLELMGRAHKLFTDKVEHSGEVAVIADAGERAERAAELLNRGRLRLVEKTG